MGKRILFPAVGQCIYCGSRSAPLGEEHIVAFGMGGNWILPKASCRACEAIINGFETYFMRGPWRALRAQLGIQTNNPTERPTSYRLKVSSTDPRRTIELPASDFPSILAFPKLDWPRVLAESALDPPKIRMWARVINLNKERLAAKGASEFLSDVFDHLRFAQLLAKIAHAYTVARLGLDGFHPLLPNLILKPSPALHDYVGGSLQDNQPEPNRLNGLGLRKAVARGKTYAVVAIRLFALYGTPSYYVVSGEEAR